MIPDKAPDFSEEDIARAEDIGYENPILDSNGIREKEKPYDIDERYDIDKPHYFKTDDQPSIETDNFLPADKILESPDKYLEMYLDTLGFFKSFLSAEQILGASKRTVESSRTYREFDTKLSKIRNAFYGAMERLKQIPGGNDILETVIKNPIPKYQEPEKK